MESKIFKGIIFAIAGLITLFLVLALGIFIGEKKADFSFKWAEDYHRNFAGPREGFFAVMRGGGFMSGNGVFGRILSINGQTLTVKDQDNVEKSVLVDDKTAIRIQNRNINISALKTDDNIIIIGNPNNSGQIEAKLIRVLPTNE